MILVLYSDIGRGLKCMRFTAASPAGSPTKEGLGRSVVRFYQRSRARLVLVGRWSSVLGDAAASLQRGKVGSAAQGPASPLPLL